MEDQSPAFITEKLITCESDGGKQTSSSAGDHNQINHGKDDMSPHAKKDTVATVSEVVSCSSANNRKPQSGIKGVTLCSPRSIQSSWRAGWVARTGTRESLSFSIAEFGFEKAKQLAVIARQIGEKTGSPGGRDLKDYIIAEYHKLAKSGEVTQVPPSTSEQQSKVNENVDDISAKIKPEQLALYYPQEACESRCNMVRQKDKRL